MLRQLLERLGVDYLQWRALTLTGIRLDLRVTQLGQMGMQRSENSSITTAWLSRLLIYSVMGAFISPLIWMNKDLFFTGTVFLAYIMVMIAMLVLIDFTAVVISPDDFAILGYQPISSRTFFIARLTNVLIYSTAMAMALGAIPIGVYFLTRGWNPLLGLTALGATLLSSVTVALSLALLYAWILHFVHPSRLRRVLGYLQFFMSFLIYGGYILMPRLFDSPALQGAHVDHQPWVYLIPSSWFACWLKLAAGEGGIVEMACAAGALVFLGTLIILARGRLSLDYAMALSSAAAVSEKRGAVGLSTARRPGLFFKAGENRAIALLIRNQFRYDQKFRLAVLGILPITFFYLYLGLQGGAPKDPFIEAESGFGNIWMIYLAVTLLPATLRQSLIHSDAWPASWIYYATPADRGRLILATKDFIFAFFVLPYLALVGTLLLYFFKNLAHVLLHLLLLGLLTHFLLQLTTLLRPDLPFSQPVRKGQRSSTLMLMMIVAPFLGVGTIYAFSRWIYPWPLLHAGIMVGMIGLSWLLEQAVKARVSRISRGLQYAD